MIHPNKMRAHYLGAASAGLALRLFFIWKFASTDAGDTRFYVQLARNWLDHGVYGLYLHGHLAPTDMRVPGYPAFLAGVFALFGRSTIAVMLAQAVLDLATCFLIAALAAWVASEENQRRVAIAAAWLAALCPFTANYTASILSESLATFLTALACVILFFPGALVDLPGHESYFKVNEVSFLGGIVAGIGTLVRPETPLLLIAIVLVLLGRCWKPSNWPKAARTGMWIALGMILPLLPWAARNWHTLHKVQFLAPRYSELPGEYVPRGFHAWTRTWQWRFRDVYLAQWKLNDEAIHVEDLPAAAFDSAAERSRVTELLDRYNRATTLTPGLDAGFAALARERTARRPLRTYATVPILRAAAMWITPRIELLPYSGQLWPIGASWENDPVDFSVTMGFGLLNFFYIGLAFAGAAMAWRRPATVFLVTFILLRTAFFTHIEAPEPRYMLECFPALLALAAQVWTKQGREKSSVPA